VGSSQRNWTNGLGGARLCEPQHVRNFQGAQLNPNAAWLAKRLRLTEPPAGAQQACRGKVEGGSMSAMSQPPKPGRPGPPRNPGVRELVESKRCWSPPPKPEEAKQGFRGWHERGYLPHHDAPGLIQFVTFHLADSFPESLRSEWEHLSKVEDDRERRAKLEAYLDKGRGECYLRRADVAQLVENNLRQFSGDRYELRAWALIVSRVFHILISSYQDTLILNLQPGGGGLCFPHAESEPPAPARPRRRAPAAVAGAHRHSGWRDGDNDPDLPPERGGLPGRAFPGLAAGRPGQ